LKLPGEVIGHLILVREAVHKAVDSFVAEQRDAVRFGKEK
jgi:hypothetical protein